jgi:uncharacterized protein (TIGR00251 family)
VVLDVHIQPRARRTEIVGWHGDAIKIRVGAPPVDGAANDELMAFLSVELGVTRSSLAIIGGKAGRRKRVAVTGLARAEALARLGLRKRGVP